GGDQSVAGRTARTRSALCDLCRRGQPLTCGRLMTVPDRNRPTRRQARMPQLIEVWNDTVDPKHLIGGIAIGVGIAVPAFLISDHLFSSSGGDEALSHSYALLIGIVGCILGAVIAGVLFKPKRVITTSAADTRNRQEIIDEIVEEYGPL